MIVKEDQVLWRKHAVFTGEVIYAHIHITPNDVIAHNKGKCWQRPLPHSATGSQKMEREKHSKPYQLKSYANI